MRSCSAFKAIYLRTKLPARQSLSAMNYAEFLCIFEFVEKH